MRSFHDAEATLGESMQSCPACRRFLLKTPESCPFCGEHLQPSGPGRALQALGASATAVVLAACYGGAPEKWTGMPDSGDSGQTSSDLTADDLSLELTSTGVSLVLYNAPAPMSFGIVEQGDCGDECWEAESCVGTTEGYSVCHDAGTSGVNLSRVTSADEVRASETTLFHDGNTNDIGFLLDSGDACFTWGAAESYYDDLGCTDL